MHSRKKESGVKRQSLPLGTASVFSYLWHWPVRNRCRGRHRHRHGHRHRHRKDACRIGTRAADSISVFWFPEHWKDKQSPKSPSSACLWLQSQWANTVTQQQWFLLSGFFLILFGMIFFIFSFDLKPRNLTAIHWSSPRFGVWYNIYFLCLSRIIIKK